MILTVTLNAAVARTLVVPSLTLGHRHRAPESVTLAGGKGINVARSLANPGRAGPGHGVRRRAQRRRHEGRALGGGHTLRPRRDRGALADLDGHRRPDERDPDGDQRVRARGQPGRGAGVLPAPGAPDGVRHGRRLRRQRPAEPGRELPRRPRAARPRARPLHGGRLLAAGPAGGAQGRPLAREPEPARGRERGRLRLYRGGGLPARPLPACSSSGRGTRASPRPRATPT